MMIKWNKPNIYALATFTGQDIKWLSPGWNEFPSDIWKIYEKHPDVVQLMDDKMIEVLDAPVKVKEGKKTVTKNLGRTDDPLDLKLLDEKKAIEIVKGTFKKDILQRWIDEELRHKVKRMIQLQMDELTQQQNKE